MSASMVVPQRRIAVSRLSARGLEYGATEEGARRDNKESRNEARAPRHKPLQQPPNRVESFAALILTLTQPPPAAREDNGGRLDGSRSAECVGRCGCPVKWHPLTYPDSNECVCVVFGACVHAA